ncbi:MAG: DNA repair protein RecN [Flavobacteriales bacterium]|nr:DNA repair protein RecN [Flavobacteriales bacterium]
MLQRLYIRNYAIISELEVEWGSGLTIITGETGAGKSIVLGALSLVLGKRADSSVLHAQESKCIVEAEFNTDGFALQDFLQENDIDPEPLTTLRREITPQGKSRAFINDTPVLLPVLRDLAERLIDVHSQHEVHTLKEAGFRARFLDSCADGGSTYDAYSAIFREWDAMRKKAERLESEAAKSRAEEDYLRFQWQELEELNLHTGELTDVEQRLSMLENAEEIRTSLATVTAQMNDGEMALLDGLRQAKAEISRLARSYSKAEEWAQRINSAVIDLADLTDEMERGLQSIEDDPQELARLHERVDAIQRLLSKHRRQTDAELITFQQELASKLEGIERSDSELSSLREAFSVLENELNMKADALTEVRTDAAKGLGERLSEELHGLGMPDAQLSVSLEKKESVNALGRDGIQVLFSANKGQPMQDISKVASGGELSRLMLVIKAEMARNAQLPTVIFDEIDTGVSGEVAERMGLKIKELSGFMQVLCITHLPQIAAKGAQHLFVYKEGDGDRTVTRIRQLTGPDRVLEIAKMLSSDSPTEAAITHARQLVHQV